jgi:hypothetical protein
MNTKKIFPCGTLVVGSLIALTGIACVVMYVLEAIVARVGEPDQSLLFWYLPFLFVGLIGIFIGLGIGIWGAIRLKKIRQQDTTPEN